MECSFFFFFGPVMTGDVCRASRVPPAALGIIFACSFDQQMQNLYRYSILCIEVYRYRYSLNIGVLSVVLTALISRTSTNTANQKRLYRLYICCKPNVWKGASLFSTKVLVLGGIFWFAVLWAKQQWRGQG